jgi:hypothetical protein
MTGPEDKGISKKLGYFGEPCLIAPFLLALTVAFPTCQLFNDVVLIRSAHSQGVCFSVGLFLLHFMLGLCFLCERGWARMLGIVLFFRKYFCILASIRKVHSFEGADETLQALSMNFRCIYCKNLFSLGIGVCFYGYCGYRIFR